MIAPAVDAQQDSELVEIQGMTLQVRDIRSVGDGAECRAKLSRL